VLRGQFPINIWNFVDLFGVERWSSSRGGGSGVYSFCTVLGRGIK